MSGEHIVSDWNQKIVAYNMPSTLRDYLSRISCKQIVFNSSGIDCSLVECYFGNLPSEKKLSKYPNIKWVHFGSIGTDKLSEEFIKKKRLTVTNSKKVNSSSVVTYCIGELFRSCKANIHSRSSLKKNVNTRNYFNNFFSSMIDYKDIVVAILGYGDIGQELVQILQPMVKHINVATRSKRNNKKNVYFYSLEDIKEATKKATHVINVLPLHASTSEIVTYDVLNSLDSAYYICAGRAETHSEDSILNLIENGNLRGASIDVFGLPGGKISENLSGSDKISLTPHISGWTSVFWEKQKEILEHNINCFKNNEYEYMKNIVFLKGERYD